MRFAQLLDVPREEIPQLIADLAHVQAALMARLATPELGNILTAQEVAERFQLSVQKVYEMARTGEIPSRKMGGLVRFSERELTQWFAERGP